MAGPFLHNPTDSLAIADTATTSTQVLEVGHQYTSVSVASTAGFPDEKGYVVFGFGYAYEAGPIPYLGVGGTTTLFIDPVYVVTTTVPSGVVVNLAKRVSDDQVPHGDGDFWLTSSPAGRVACQANINEIAAGGKEITMIVNYPNDIGLGGSGLPTKGAKRLTDAVSVWAGDDVDEEVQTARIS